MNLLITKDGQLLKLEGFGEKGIVKLLFESPGTGRGAECICREARRGNQDRSRLGRLKKVFAKSICREGEGGIRLGSRLQKGLTSNSRGSTSLRADPPPPIQTQLQNLPDLPQAQLS